MELCTVQLEDWVCQPRLLVGWSLGHHDAEDGHVRYTVSWISAADEVEHKMAMSHMKNADSQGAKMPGLRT